MAGQTPERAYYPVPVGGPLDEARPATKVGDLGGLTDGINFMNRPLGAWSRRPGSGRVYTSSSSGPINDANPSGVRWYNQNGTVLVVAAQGSIWTAGDPGTVASPAALTAQFSATALYSSPVNITPVGYANGGAYTDALVICGMTGAFGLSNCFVTLSGQPTAGQVFTMTVTPGGLIYGATTITYTALSTDSLASVVQELVTLWNASAAVQKQPGIVYLYPPLVLMPVLFAVTPNGNQAYLYFSGLSSRTTSSSTVTTTITGSGTTVATSPVSFSSAGGAVSGPLITSGAATSASQLSTYFSNNSLQPARSVWWHNHLWLWGDSNNPNTLYVSDLNEPTSYQFMYTAGPYLIGPGDGDYGIQNCVPMGNSLYIFKRNTVYVVTGYDFQNSSSNVAFSIEPQVLKSGIPAPDCVTVMNNALYYWDGAKFNRLVSGAYNPENIGAPIAYSAGQVAIGNQTQMRVVGGNFLYQTNNNIIGQTLPQQELLTNCVFFVCSAPNLPNGSVCLVYDDDASQFIGAYAWNKWQYLAPATGLVPFGNGPTTSGTPATDPQRLFTIVPVGNASHVDVYEFGYDAAIDKPTVTSIPWFVQTGWITQGTPALIKVLHRIKVQFEATGGIQFLPLEVYSGGAWSGSGVQLFSVATPVLPLTQTPPYAGVNAQEIIATLAPQLRGNSFMLNLTYVPGSGVEDSFVLTGIVLDTLEEPFTP